jgi:hypothetical protein
MGKKDSGNGDREMIINQVPIKVRIEFDVMGATLIDAEKFARYIESFPNIQDLPVPVSISVITVDER